MEGSTGLLSSTVAKCAAFSYYQIAEADAGRAGSKGRGIGLLTVAGRLWTASSLTRC
jgi:hypothetical protein